MKNFKDIEIKAGYLLKVESDSRTAPFKRETHYMTVVPTRNAGLGCVTPVGNRHFWPLDKFNREGVFQDSVIQAVYGPTYARFLLDNCPDDREILWEREKETPAVDMTLEEIEKKLGHPVRIVKAENN